MGFYNSVKFLSYPYNYEVTTFTDANIRCTVYRNHVTLHNHIKCLKINRLLFMTYADIQSSLMSLDDHITLILSILQLIQISWFESL